MLEKSRQIWGSIRSWRPPATFRVAVVIVAVAYAIMIFANVWPLDPDEQCPWVFPKVMSCVLAVRENLAGGVLGAGGALFAAWIAWVAVQRQLAVQQRQALIDDLTFWQKKYDDSAVAISGLEMVGEVANRCINILETLRRPTDAYMPPKHPHIEAVKRIKNAGLLDSAQFPRTGSNLIAWHMADYLGRLRVQHERSVAFKLEDHPGREDCESSLRDVLDLIQQLQRRIPTEYEDAK